ncbi:MAG TPA: diguanylate cyclase [Phycisphaerae bacterium]|nr:diguanylate cyclase [Phycisphaerae bacterium]HOM51667.1 diguanylate cyclase [Phycisphaerae bacterium]HOQ88018.1 diguanylate cyclase [Phycisphaerae bacterium]HPP25639.1 diguanylate cyclase [Phycisphaerae bacterium]
MNQAQPLTLRSTLWLAMALTVASTALGAVALHSYRLHRQTHLSERLRAQAIAEAYAAQIAPRLVASRRADLAALLRGLSWHSDSRLIALLDSAGELLAARGDTQMLERYSQLCSTDAGPTWHVKGNPSELAIEYTLAAVPLTTDQSSEPLGTLVYAMVTPAGAGAISLENWGFFLYVAIIASLGICLGFLWLQRRILQPLADLARLGQAQSGEPAEGLPTHREDEIGMLARTMARMQSDASYWEQRASRLERTLNDRVAHATQRITRELKQAQKKIWTDPLTHLGNRRLLDDKLGEIFQAQADSGQELSLVMMDVDNFKPLNDSLGHRAGDALLRFTGELLRQCLREQDLAVRYGGDEFVLILPSVMPEQAQTIAERAIALFAQHSSTLNVKAKPTMSAGIASLQRHRPESAESLLQMADAALYQAKSAGKARAAILATALEPAGV